MKKPYAIGAFAVLLCCMFMTNTAVYANEQKDYEINFVSGEFGCFKLDENECDKIVFQNIAQGSLWNDFIEIPKVIPDENYIFVGWSKTGTKEIITNFPESIEENSSYTANFAILSSVESDELPSPQKKMSLLYKLYLFCVQMGG